MRPLIPFLLSLVLLVASCSGRDDDSAGARTFAHATRAPMPDSLGRGDVRIADADSGVDLALIGDTISAGLSARTLAKIRLETDTAAVSGSGLGASIERMVKSTVQRTIGTRVAFPVSAVKDVHYDAGKIVFEWIGKPLTLFENAKVNDKPVTWRVEDAQRFIDAVHARQKTGPPLQI